MLYGPGANWLASKVAAACVVSFEVLPAISEDVPRAVPPEEKVTIPVAGEPIPEAATVAVSKKDCVVCCEASLVLVAMRVMVKLTGVKLALELKLLSP